MAGAGRHAPAGPRMAPAAARGLPVRCGRRSGGGSPGAGPFPWRFQARKVPQESLPPARALAGRTRRHDHVCGPGRPCTHPHPPPPPPRRGHARVQGRRESSDVWRRHLCRQAWLRRHAAPVFATGEPKARVPHLQGPRVAARGRCAQGARTGCSASAEPGGRLAEARSARAAAGRISASECRSHGRLFLRGQLLAERKAAWSAGPGPSRGAARPPRARGKAKKRVLD